MQRKKRNYPRLIFLFIRIGKLSFPQTTMLQAIERYMKQAIVDKVPSVSSSALVSSLVNKWQFHIRFRLGPGLISLYIIYHIIAVV